MLIRTLIVAAALSSWHGALLAAPDCPAPVEARKGADPIVDWYDAYIRPYRKIARDPATPRLTKFQVEAFIQEIAPFHRRAVLDQLIFETLVEQVMTSYARASDFKDIDTAAVEKIYNSGIGQKLDFSLMCITSRSVRAPDDAFAITLFGVVADDCQHIGLRGLVFTAALINGSPNGLCRPDQAYSRMIFIPLPAGTNEITFVCAKDRGGCARQ